MDVLKKQNYIELKHENQNFPGIKRIFEEEVLIFSFEAK